MKRWNLDTLKRALDAFGGGPDPDDPKAKRRLRILEAATALFVAQGYRKTSVDQIAERAGIGKGTIYLHFKTKPEILLHAVAEEKRKILERMKPLFEPGLHPRERLRAWLRAALLVPQENPLLGRLLKGDRDVINVLYDYGREVAHQDWLSWQVDIMSTMVGEAAGEHAWTATELRDRAKVFLGLVYFSSLLGEERIRGGLSMERYAEILSDLIVDGIAPVRGGSGPAAEGKGAGG